ncbi:MAG: 2-oxoglutarate dehydrogenase E1 component, partial [Fermentimonas sp.]|nr:2-oxoglutarate dehydrogenase E1 component [Fermentimonas sp.]
VFTPKSLLRHPECTSSISDFTEKEFLEVIEDEGLQSKSNVKKLILCTGKIFYELNAERRELNANHVSIIRLEQLYPFPEKQIKNLINSYPKDTELVWVQEEPLNMGAALYIKQKLEDYKLKVISRPASGVTAEGLTALHKINQAEIINRAFE